tara:strand:+ start:640 stop:2625 length:1986 start_codon:yes stop_codon:yes gene_type:complete
MGLTLNTSNGQITLPSSTAGNYEVTRTVTNTPSSLFTTATDVVTINPADDAAFSYSGSPYDIASASNPTPTVTGLPGGTFSSNRNSFDFDGNDDYINAGSINTIDINTPWTYNVWFYWPSITQDMVFMSKIDQPSTQGHNLKGFSLALTEANNASHGRRIIFALYNGTVANAVRAVWQTPPGVLGPFVSGQWNCLTVTFDGTALQSSGGTNLKMFANGSPATLNYSTARLFDLTTITNSQPFYIGATNGTPNNTIKTFFDGQMSNIAIWNSDQSSNISNIYNSGSPQTSYTVNPTIWYKTDTTSTFSSGTWTIPNASNPGTLDASSDTLSSTSLTALNINSTTGLISLSTSSIGTFPVTYNTTGATGSLCPATSTQSVQLVNTNFDYPTNVCNATGSPTVLPTNFVQQTGGVFSISPTSGAPGIDATSGLLSPAGSTAATYAITYTIGSNSTTKNVTSTNVLAPSTTTNTSTLSFNGTSSYIDAGNSSIFNLQGSFSISLWVYSASFQNYVHLLSKLNGGTDYTGWRIQIGQTNVRIQTSNMSSGITVAKNMNTATWYHMFFTYDGTYLNYYQNGSNAILNNAFFVSPPSNNNNNLRIGKGDLTDAGGAAHNGKIDEIAIWDKALTSCDAAGIYQASSNGITADLSTVYPSNLKYYNRMGD